MAAGCWKLVPFSQGSSYACPCGVNRKLSFGELPLAISCQMFLRGNVGSPVFGVSLVPHEINMGSTTEFRVSFQKVVLSIGQPQQERPPGC